MTQISQSPITGIIHLVDVISNYSLKDYVSKEQKRKIDKILFGISLRASTVAKLEGHTITLYCLMPRRRKLRKPGLTVEMYIQPLSTKESRHMDVATEKLKANKDSVLGMFTTVPKKELPKQLQATL